MYQPACTCMSAKSPKRVDGGVQEYPFPMCILTRETGFRQVGGTWVVEERNRLRRWRDVAWRGMAWHVTCVCLCVVFVGIEESHCGGCAGHVFEGLSVCEGQIGRCGWRVMLWVQGPGSPLGQARRAGPRQVSGCVVEFGALVREPVRDGHVHVSE